MENKPSASDQEGVGAERQDGHERSADPEVRGEALGHAHGAKEANVMSSGNYRGLSVFKEQFVEEIAKATEGMSEEQKASFMLGYEKGKQAGADYERKWLGAQANKK